MTMSIIIKDGVFVNLQDLDTPDLFEVSRDMSPPLIAEKLGSSSGFLIPFPTYGDGWGFSIAKALRDQGFKGYLRARGHIIPDQYPLAIRSGFDDIEIPDDLAARSTEQPWKNAYNRCVLGTYQDKLRSGS